MTEQKSDKKSADNQPFLIDSWARRYILLSLLDGPKHGYAILKSIPELSQGTYSIAAGNLYTITEMLADMGVIQYQPPTNPIQINRRSRRPRRSMMSITEKGLIAFMEDNDRIRAYQTAYLKVIS